MSIHSFSLLTSLSIASLAYCPSAIAQNLIPNPSFESGTTGWGQFIPTDADGKVQPIQLVYSDVHSGTTAAEINVAGGARTAIIVDNINVKPGQKYRFIAWVKFTDNAQLKAGMPGAYLRVTLLEARGKDIADPLGAFYIDLQGKVARKSTIGKLAITELPRHWTKLEGVIEIPEGTNLTVPSIFLQGVTGTVIIDDVSFEMVPDNTSLSSIIE